MINRHYYIDGISNTYSDAYDPDRTLHREDGPAIEYASGTKVWYQHGQCHREDGPALECADGAKFWYLHGKLHREDGPAIEYVNGRKQWYLHNEEINCDNIEMFVRLCKLKAFW